MSGTCFSEDRSSRETEIKEGNKEDTIQVSTSRLSWSAIFYSSSIPAVHIYRATSPSGVPWKAQIVYFSSANM